MPQLTKQMYQSVNVPGLFGLSNDQLVGGIQNAGWYNGRGEFIGYGDLERSNVECIAAEIDPREVFVVLSEEDWRGSRHPHLKAERGYEEAPFRFLAEHALLLIRRGQVYWCCRQQYKYTVAEWELSVKLVATVERAMGVIAGL